MNLIYFKEICHKIGLFFTYCETDDQIGRRLSHYSGAIFGNGTQRPLARSRKSENVPIVLHFLGSARLKKTVRVIQKVALQEESVHLQSPLHSKHRLFVFLCNLYSSRQYSVSFIQMFSRHVCKNVTTTALYRKK